jgi:2-polyprenyl-3-methyl-5-hydroxy-6-metoxy-1,4-benzoquinol methylase
MTRDSVSELQEEKTMEGYFSIVNSAIAQLIPDNPGRILDIGCAYGSLGEMIVSKKANRVCRNRTVGYRC